ncbi:mycofactocin-coupled SDR family oxidoreductase [Rhodococcus sp. T2V]|uniref:mycofactocin-coupled SDR family oxidoreductase n=1 Tax=Rhodococcus sp. T2V TaxID=3034164 RepID=UPI0023E17038|nr:mycofactocin-coupled SDR family oxidoreductase [Rhodococcus sp. T2V]MDF3306429.1 mycofactocin-coupled SDR family oxidoreductase [Rhodococcus sp. T2V]
MTQSLAGKVALVTGAARGQGRSHALRLAQEGADLILVDRCAPYSTIGYSMPTPEDLNITVKEVESLGRRAVAGVSDVRDLQALGDIVQSGFDEFGRLDVVAANAGIFAFGVASSAEIGEERWNDVLSTNVTGVFNTLKVAVPLMRQAGNGGSIIITSSTAGMRGLLAMADYSASKHAVVGIMRTFANELAPENIRVNTIHPTGVSTEMIDNAAFGQWMAATPQISVNLAGNLLPVDKIEPGDLSEAVVWLASDAARFVTGAALPIDAGFTARA